MCARPGLSARSLARDIHDGIESLRLDREDAIEDERLVDAFSKDFGMTREQAEAYLAKHRHCCIHVLDHITEMLVRPGLVFNYVWQVERSCDAFWQSPYRR